MLSTFFGAVVTFFIKTLSVLLGIVVFVIPIVLKIAFGAFILTSSFALIWMFLVGLTIFLAPMGGVRKHLDISYPDDDRPYDDATKERIQMEEILFTLLLPKTYLPQLLKETGLAIGTFTIDATVMFAMDLGNFVINTGVGILNKVRATRFGALILPKIKVDPNDVPIGYRPSW
ncbi:MAG: hypothetical protein HY226_06035 [Candidatus Vogelbacteria bacterium]|nr:hypothetical protein [Candidatus Vogelbacteria bacterium]